MRKFWIIFICLIAMLLVSLLTFSISDSLFASILNAIIMGILLEAAVYLLKKSDLTIKHNNTQLILLSTFIKKHSVWYLFMPTIQSVYYLLFCFITY